MRNNLIIIFLSETQVLMNTYEKKIEYWDEKIYYSQCFSSLHNFNEHTSNDRKQTWKIPVICFGGFN